MVFFQGVGCAPWICFTYKVNTSLSIPIYSKLTLITYTLSTSIPLPLPQTSTITEVAFKPFIEKTMFFKTPSFILSNPSSLLSGCEHHQQRPTWPQKTFLWSFGPFEKHTAGIT